MDTSTIETMLTEYIHQMTPKEKKAMEIAKRLLRDSFDLKKSNGFLEFKEKMIPK